MDSKNTSGRFLSLGGKAVQGREADPTLKEIHDFFAEILGFPALQKHHRTNQREPSGKLAGIPLASVKTPDGVRQGIQQRHRLRVLPTLGRKLAVFPPGDPIIFPTAATLHRRRKRRLLMPMEQQDQAEERVVGCDQLRIDVLPKRPGPKR